MIYDELAAELHFRQDADQRPSPVSRAQPARDESGPGENDDLIARTDNGLRHDDVDLGQPPQDPDWIPGA